MKIVCDNNTFVIPFNSSDKILLITNYQKEIIECYQSYFVSKKKTKCLFYNDDGEIMNMNDINFIYLSDDVSYENNLNFKNKTIFNNEVSQLINNNPELFLSLEKARNELNSLSTDTGIFKLQKILNLGINKRVQFDLKDFDINIALQLFNIVDNEFTLSEKQILIYNLLLYINRNKTNVVYIDKDIDETLISWTSNYNVSTIFILDNNVVMTMPEKYDCLILSNKDHLISNEESFSNLKIISYMNHNIIKANISLQDEKNIELFNQYQDNNSTFFIKNRL